MNENFGRGTDVITPEQVRLKFGTAGIGSRVGAQLIDVFFILCGLTVIVLIVGLTMSILRVNIDDWLAEYAIAFILIAAFALIGGYFIAAEYFFSGQTPGKRIMGLRTLQNDGRPPTFLAALIRNVFRLIDILPFFYVLGAVWMFFHPQDKRLGDLAAGTMVIRDERAAQLRLRRRARRWIKRKMGALPHIQWPEETPPELGRDDWQLISSFAERMPTLEPRTRYELATRIAQIVAPKLGLDSSDYKLYPDRFLAAIYTRLVDEWPV